MLQSRTFLPAYACSFLGGVGVGLVSPISPTVPLVLAASAVLLAAGCLRRPWLWLAGLVASGALTGAGLGAAALETRQPACDVARHALRRAVRLSGDIVATRLDQRGQLRLQVRAARIGDLRRGLALDQPVCGVVEVLLPGSTAPAAAGTSIVAEGRLLPAVGGRNPGTPTSQRRYEREQIRAVLAVKERADLLLLEPPSSSWVAALRTRMQSAISASIASPEPRSLVLAMALDDRSQMSEQQTQQLARAGIIHVIAVSGQHLSVVIGAVMILFCWLLRRITPLLLFGHPRKLAAPLALAVGVVYTVLTGAGTSTLRSCIMAGCVMTGLVLDRPGGLFRSLCLAAALLLFWDPVPITTPGFQLSFVAVLCIAAVLARKHDEAPIDATPRTLPRKLVGYVVELVKITTCVTVVTAPIIAHHFGQCSAHGLWTNLAAVPLASCVTLPASLLGALAGAIHPVLGKPLLAVASVSAVGLGRLGAVAAANDWLTVYARPSGLCALAAVVVLFGLWLTGRTRRCVLVAGAALLALCALRHLGECPADAVSFTFLDVGQGDSTLVRFPSGEHMLVDGGGASKGAWDPGALRLVPFFAAQGIRTLDVVVATHPHPDHVGGLPSVLRSVDVKELWIAAPQGRAPGFEALLEAARQRRIPVRWPAERHFGVTHVKPLWPPAHPSANRVAPSPGNNSSVVLRIEHRGSVALLTGDIEAASEQTLVTQDARQLRADLLKVPHHGSLTSSTPPFLKAVTPHVAVVSAGYRNGFRFPREEVVRRYRKAGAKLLRVDELGAVEVFMQSQGKWRYRTLWPRAGCDF